jgi:hypothetical protein
MLMRKVAVISESKKIKFGDVLRVGAALHTQAVRDLAPTWNISAMVNAYETLEDMPIGYWPMMILDNIHQPGAAGIHQDKDGQPIALVSAGAGWSLTASHEMIEMLVDPFGRRMAEGHSPKEGQGRVQFLVEPCDPSEDEQFSYSIDDVAVSDFYTPLYFKERPKAGESYSHTGAIEKPRDVLFNGYLSWHDPVSDNWWQRTMFDGVEDFRDLGRFDEKSGKSPRREIYDRMPTVYRNREARAGKVEAALAARRETSQPSRANHAKSLRERISQIRESYKPS